MTRPSIDDALLLADFESGLEGTAIASAPVRASSWAIVEDAAKAFSGTKFLRWSGDARPPGDDPKAPFIPQRFAFSTRIEGTGVRQELRVFPEVKVSTGSAPEVSSGLHAVTFGVEQYAADGTLLQTDMGADARNFPPYPNSSVGWGGAPLITVLREDMAYGVIFAEVTGGATASIDIDRVRYLVYPFVDYGTPLPDTGGVTVSPETGVVVTPSAPAKALARAKLPAARESFVNAQGKPAVPFYAWAQSLDRNVGEVAAIADEAKAIVRALPRQLGSPDGTVGRIPRPGSFSVTGNHSVTSFGSDGRFTVSLVNDSSAPGLTAFYGTNTDGERGWQPFTSALIAGDSITLTPGTDGRVTVAATGGHYTRIAADGSIRMAADSSLRISD